MHSLAKWILPASFLASTLIAQPPQLIDREVFFGDPEISGAQISPDGKFIAFLKPLSRTRNIWVKRTEEPFTSAKPITAETKRPIPAYFWSRDGRYVLFVQDKDGDENYNVYAVNPADAPAAGAQVPPARNLTDAKGVRAAIYAVPRTEPDIIYAGLNDRDKAWHDLYKVRISTGERTLLRKNTDRLTGWVFDLKDQLRLATRSADNGDTEILRVDPDGFKKIYSCSVVESCSPVQFQKGGQLLYMVSNKGEANFAQLITLDPQTGKETLVESDPLKRVDLNGVMISEVTDRLIATIYNDDKVRVYWKDKSWETDYKWIKSKLPGKELRAGSHTKDERFWLMTAFSDAEPGETYLFDRKYKNLNLQYRVREKLPREALASMQPVRYKSSDGLEIPGYLTLPKGAPAKNLPAVVVPHGGPWGRDNWGYDGVTQFLANRGYAVLQMNFRGSTGYGKKFLNAGNKEWGQKMQDDITWGVKYLEAGGIADPKRVGIMGGSYGGYATLAGVAFTPDVYAAAVSIVGPSNLITLLNSIPPYWEQVRKMFVERMGDPNTPEGKAQLERQSPLNSASKIKTPLLVVQGANDPRVNKAESDQIVVALRDRGFPVEYLVAPDEGHGFARPVNSMAMYAAAERFLAKHLGGRYQEGATPEVAARLKEITVDPKTVVLAKKVEAGAVGLPKLSSQPQPGVMKYQAKIEMGGQSVDLPYTTEVKEEGGAWLVTDAIQTPMGVITNTATLNKETLALLKRTSNGGPMSMAVEFKDNKAKGKVTAQGSDRPIDTDMGGPIFADETGGAQSLACLPLAEGFQLTYRNFDLPSQKARVMAMKVAGLEKVKVAAGEFEAYKLEIAPADGSPGKSTLWIAKESRKPIKVVATLPQMGGATLTSELQ